MSDVSEPGPPADTGLSLRPIIDAVVEFFGDDGWTVDRLDGQVAVRVMFRGEHGEWPCYAQAREADRQLVVYSACPVAVPPDRRLAVAEMITRCNFGLLIGNFELDMNDGELRFKTGLDVEQTELTGHLIRPLVYANVLSMDRFLPAILRVIYGGESPLDLASEFGLS